MTIDEARKAATEFLGRMLQKEGTAVKMSKTSEGWEVQVEVIEVSEYIKALGIPTVVHERNLYEVKLDQKLDVVSCERIGQQMAGAKTA